VDFQNFGVRSVVVLVRMISGFWAGAGMIDFEKKVPAYQHARRALERNFIYAFMSSLVDRLARKRFLKKLVLIDKIKTV
jgi:hypothetical protein